MTPAVKQEARKRVYVAGPYSAGNVMQVFENMRRGMRVATELTHEGYAPFCPWHDYHHSLMTDPLAGETLSIRDYYETTIAYLDVSDVVFVIPTDDNVGTHWQDSVGTLVEINRAIDRGIDVVIGSRDLLRLMCPVNEAAGQLACRRLELHNQVISFHRGVYFIED